MVPNKLAQDLPSLLARYVSARSDIKTITRVLRDAGLARTDNFVGELGERLALQVYGGELASTSARDIDLIGSDGRRVQVKTRALPAGDLRVYDFASLDFELAVCIRFEMPSFTLKWAREFTTASLAAVATARPAGFRVTGARARDNGADMTSSFQKAWAEMRTGALDA